MEVLWGGLLVYQAYYFRGKEAPVADDGSFDSLFRKPNSGLVGQRSDPFTKHKSVSTHQWSCQARSSPKMLVQKPRLFTMAPPESHARVVATSSKLNLAADKSVEEDAVGEEIDFSIRASR